MKKVIVTGAGGFIGGCLTELLLKNDIIVYGIDVNKEVMSDYILYDNFHPIIASFKEYDTLDEIIEDKIDVFYHFAWQGVFGDSFKDYNLQLSNVKYACDALMQAKKMGCKKFVFAGTINEFEVIKYQQLDFFEPRYTCLYASCKNVTEMICKTLAYNNNIEYSAGLISMVFGEGNKSKMLPNVVITQLINSVEPKLIEGKNLYDLIYVKDVARAFFSIGESGKNLKSYYIGHRRKEIKPFKEWITEIRDIVNPNISLNFGEYKDSLDMDYSLIDTDALYIDTGFECKYEFKKSIIDTAIWLKEQGK